ncbi:tyrosine-protein phosphatase [Lactobacillus psittaci]|uniref:Protein-tyrosine phosphatase n=1 Tax=Lactobacillus psittaci DSM 15354 TaxID=1122152 RepID=A0A0R1S215_9LACO|nr:tyrosine-protein phosphatase [Lactobacillus psittaci]KRL63025.1 protein-tyrosine phosphatase [Lactobacillus psittaci DSM 15354]
MARLVKLDGASNFRDLGGYVGLDGRKVKSGKLYRADSLSSLSDQDLETLTRLNIRIDCDLRSIYEQEMAPDKRWNAELVDCHLYAEAGERNNKFLEKWLHHIKPVDDYLGQIYQRVILSPHSQKMFAQVFEKMLELADDQALVFHCSAGKDRTGMTAALILMGLGVDDETISKDYLLTNELYHFAYSNDEVSDDDLGKMVAKMNITRGEGQAITGITETIRMGWGSFDNFFIHVLGFSKDDLQEIRTKFLEAK